MSDGWIVAGMRAGMRARAEALEGLLAVARVRIALWVWPQRYCGWGHCANRWWSTYDGRKGRYVLLAVNKERPSMMAREEAVRLLAIVRHVERRTGWKVPEPDAQAVEATEEVFP